MRRHCCIYTVAVLDRGCCRGGGLLLFVFSRYYRGALFFVTLASGMAACHLSQPYDKAAESEGRYEGMILSAGLSPNSVRCVVETKYPVKSRIMLTVNTQDLELYAPGTIVSFTAKPESVSAPDDVPWQTNRQRYLYNEGIGLHALSPRIKSPSNASRAACAACSSGCGRELPRQ